MAFSIWEPTCRKWPEEVPYRTIGDPASLVVHCTKTSLHGQPLCECVYTPAYACIDAVN